MPRILVLVLAAALGLLTGFMLVERRDAWLVVLPGTAAVVAAAGLTVGPRVRRVAGPLLVAAAAAHAAADARTADARCRAAAVREGVVRAVVEAPAAPGARVRAHLMGARCRVPVSLAVRGGRAPAGAEVLARGTVLPTERGLRVTDAVLVPTGPVARHIAWRHRLGLLIDRLYGPEAPLVRALVLADADGIGPEVRDRYADAGLVHALSVSGLHVAIIASALLLALRALRLSPDAATLAGCAGVAAYVALLGAPAPALRAAVMLAGDAAARVLQRPTSPWAVLALGAGLPLHDPRAVLDLGYQLSVAGMAALVAGRTLWRRLRSVPHPRLVGWRRGWRAGLAREVLVGTMATCVTAPLVAWHFGRVSLVGILANLAAGPLLAALQPALFLSLLLAPAGAVAALCAAGARPLLLALDRVATAAAAVPGAVLAVAPTLAGALLAGGAALALLAAASARRPGRPLLAALGCLAGAVWLPLAPRLPRGERPVAELHLLDVGQGDAVALRSPRGRWVLVDAGGAWRSGDVGGRTVVPYLRRRGGALALLVLTHPHADHVGGAASVLERLRPPMVWDAAFALGSSTYEQVLTEARRLGARWRRVQPGDSLDLDGLVLRVLAPDSAWTAGLADPNLASVVVSARFGRVRFLLTGDAEVEEERWLLARAARDPALAAALRADVLKLGHHGSATSTSPEFLAAVRPRVALVSVGAGNRYGHPDLGVLRRVGERAEVLRTDRLGTVVVRTDGERIELEAAGERWPVSGQSGAAGDGAR